MNVHLINIANSMMMPIFLAFFLHPAYKEKALRVGFFDRIIQKAGNIWKGMGKK